MRLDETALVVTKLARYVLVKERSEGDKQERGHAAAYAFASRHSDLSLVASASGGQAAGARRGS